MRHGKYIKGHREYRGNIKNRISIENRPEAINQRTRLGDYEIDLVVGVKNRGAILTMIDRLSRRCILEKLPNKSSESVANIVIQSLKKHGSSPSSITSDNGTEFTLHQEISLELDIDYYFAHPYASYERGSIENLNGLIRQYIPKGTDFSDILNTDIKIIQEKLNNRPRKILDFLAPNEYTKNKLEIVNA
jgi:transposase, IS30 family